MKLYARDHVPRYDITASIPLEDETGADHPRGSLYETPRVIGAGWPGFAPERVAPGDANRR